MAEEIKPEEVKIDDVTKIEEIMKTKESEENKTVEIKEKTSDEIMKQMNDMLNLNEVADLINSNEKVFEFEGVTYRIKRPNFNQKQEICSKKMEKYVEMLKNDKYLLIKDLKELYKKRGIDLDVLEINLKNKIKKRDSFMIKLGAEIKSNSNDILLKSLKTEIEEINNEIQVLSIEKASLLEISIEQQLIAYVYSYLVYLIAEKKEEEKWIRVWNTYEEFMNSKQGLINRLIYYGTMMIGTDGI